MRLSFIHGKTNGNASSFFSRELWGFSGECLTITSQDTLCTLQDQIFLTLISVVKWDEQFENLETEQGGRDLQFKAVSYREASNSDYFLKCLQCLKWR